MDGLMSGHCKGPRLEQYLTASSVQSCQLLWCYSWITNLLLQLKKTCPNDQRCAVGAWNLESLGILTGMMVCALLSQRCLSQHRL